MGKVITSHEDCADCLCRVCARNMCNDSYNELHERSERMDCSCDCNFGDKIIETEDDCNFFLPSEDEKGDI